MKLISSKRVRVRMAPSPTGPFHIGSARTALFNYLFAKSQGGNFVLRIEDTDQERSEKQWENDVYFALDWLGIPPNEGPQNPGKFGPYLQSQRQKIYQEYFKNLQEKQQIYPCFCTKEELAEQKKFQEDSRQAPKYSGKCSGLSQVEIEKNLQYGKPCVWRLKTPAIEIVFEDIARGKIKVDTGMFGDIVVAKSETEPLYNLACVIDDFEMQITHIIRGEDHISNTPKQILIARALAIDFNPQYLHLPLILDQHRAKLSKRNQEISTAVSDYKEQGYLAEALINFLAFLGWNPGDNREIIAQDDLIKDFSLQKIQKAGAVFNAQKLDWLNGHYIRQKSLSDLTQDCLPFLAKANIRVPEDFSFDYCQKVIGLYQERLKKLSEIFELCDDFFQETLNYPKELLFWKEAKETETKIALEKILELLEPIKVGDWTKENLEKILIQEAQTMANRGILLWPLRVAITGKKASAGPFEVAEVLGKEKTLKRIRDANIRMHTNNTNNQ